MLTQKPLRIAFTGKKGSGKNFAADIVNKHYNSKILAFADPLKKIIIDTFQLDNEREYDNFKRNNHFINLKNIPGRDIVRNTGMAMLQANPNFFLDEAAKQLTENCCISDARFEHEFKWLNKHNFIIIKILNENCDNQDDHISEQINIPENILHYTIVNTNDKKFETYLIKLIEELQNVDY